VDLDKLYKILNDTTVQLRKGDEVIRHEPNNGLAVTEIFAMPHEHEPCVDHLERVDMEFLTIGVDRSEAQKRKSELVEILNTYPQPDRLAGGPSYIEVGAEIGDQGAAFQLFALGKVLGLWDVITPASLGIKGEQARQMAGRGMIMMSGFKAAA